MNFRKSVLLSLAVVAFAAPGISSATSSWHGTKGGESGGDLVQPPLKSTKTRAEVLQELQAARKDGTLLSTAELERGVTATAKTEATSKTRTQVQNELLAMSAGEKQRMHGLYSGV